MKLKDLSTKLRKKAVANIKDQNRIEDPNKDIIHLFDIDKSSEGKDFWLHIMNTSSKSTEGFKKKVYNLSQLSDKKEKPPIDSEKTSGVQVTNHKFIVTNITANIENKAGDTLELELKKDGKVYISTENWSYTDISELSGLFERLKSITKSIE